MVKRIWENGLRSVTIERSGYCEVFITVYCLEGEKIQDILKKLQAELRRTQIEVLKFDVFGSLGKYHDFLKQLYQELSGKNVPVTWIEGESCSGDDLAGIQVYGISGSAVGSPSREVYASVRCFEDEACKYCLIGNLFPQNTQGSMEEQTEEVLKGLENTLNASAMEMKNIVIYS